MCDKLFTLIFGDDDAGVTEACVACGDGCEEGADGVEEGTTRLVGGSAGRGVECDCPLSGGLGGGCIEPELCGAGVVCGAETLLYGGGG